MNQFTLGELNVMSILWEHGELKPPEIRERFPRPIKDAALRSYLRILMEKGHVTRRRKGRPFYYRAKTKKESVFRVMSRQLVETFFAGSTGALVCRLVKTERLTEEERLELLRLASRDDERTLHGKDDPA